MKRQYCTFWLLLIRTVRATPWIMVVFRCVGGRPANLQRVSFYGLGQATGSHQLLKGAISCTLILE